MQTLNPFLTPILQALDHYLSAFPLTTEHELIKHLQDQNIPPFDQLELINPKELFSAHFLCMHALYHLKKQYLHSQNFTLDIQSVRVQKIAIETSQGDNELNTAMEVSDPLEEYYLNSAHYFETQEDEINEMLSSFWQKYLANDSKKEALATLELPLNADAKMVKNQYLRLAQQHHPDKGGCAEKFSKICHAKTILEQSL